MKIQCLCLLILFIFHCVIGQQEGATCSIGPAGEEYCENTAESNAIKNDDKQDHSFCLPDGACFESIGAALLHYERLNHSIQPRNPRPYGESQQISFSTVAKKTKTLEVLALTHEYMTNLFQNETAKPFRNECKLRSEKCAYWASIGECEAVSASVVLGYYFFGQYSISSMIILSINSYSFSCSRPFEKMKQNPAYMKIQCAPACRTCEYLSFEHRCPFDRTAPNAWGPGDVNKMFERLTTEPYYVEKYEPAILSQPPEGPWVITLENVMTKQQCQRLIRLGADRGYTRSKTRGREQFDGKFASKVSELRSSHNAWCQEECFRDETTQTVLENLENITGIPDANSEYLQLLRYEETQQYGVGCLFFHSRYAQTRQLLD